MCDGQIWKFRCLYHDNEAPESSGQRAISPSHRSDRVWLSKGAADLIGGACAGSATTSYVEPVNGVGLGEADAWDHQGEEQNWIFHKRLISVGLGIASVASVPLRSASRHQSLHSWLLIQRALLQAFHSNLEWPP